MLVFLKTHIPSFETNTIPVSEENIQLYREWFGQVQEYLILFLQTVGRQRIVLGSHSLELDLRRAARYYCSQPEETKCPFLLIAFSTDIDPYCAYISKVQGNIIAEGEIVIIPDEEDLEDIRTNDFESVYLERFHFNFREMMFVEVFSSYAMRKFAFLARFGGVDAAADQPQSSVQNLTTVLHKLGFVPYTDCERSRIFRRTDAAAVLHWPPGSNDYTVQLGAQAHGEGAHLAGVIADQCGLEILKV